MVFGKYVGMSVLLCQRIGLLLLMVFGKYVGMSAIYYPVNPTNPITQHTQG